MSQWADYRAAYGLTTKQARLFEVLTDGANHAKDELLSRVWGEGHHASDHLIPVHLNRLKNKITPFGFDIDSRRGRHSVGWRLYRPDGLPLAIAQAPTPSPERTEAL